MEKKTAIRQRFTYVGKNEEGGYSVWAPDVIYNKKMGKYVMYFCTTSSYVKSNICFATADDIEVRITMRIHSCTLVIAIMMLRKVISKTDGNRPEAIYSSVL